MNLLVLVSLRYMSNSNLLLFLIISVSRKGRVPSFSISHENLIVLNLELICVKKSFILLLLLSKTANMSSTT